MFILYSLCTLVRVLAQYMCTVDIHQQYWHERQRCSRLHAGFCCIASQPFAWFVFYCNIWSHSTPSLISTFCKPFPPLLSYFRENLKRFPCVWWFHIMRDYLPNYNCLQLTWLVGILKIKIFWNSIQQQDYHIKQSWIDSNLLFAYCIWECYYLISTSTKMIIQIWYFINRLDHW